MLYLPVSLFYTYITRGKMHAWNAQVLFSLNISICKHYRNEEWNPLQWNIPTEFSRSLFTGLLKSPSNHGLRHPVARLPLHQKDRLSRYIAVHTQKVNDYVFPPKTCFKTIICLFSGFSSITNCPEYKG